jgi:uncharacterized protein YjiS (DUF1127 family)
MYAVRLDNPEDPGGEIGCLEVRQAAILAPEPQSQRRLKMTTKLPVLPLAGATLARGFAGLALQATRFSNALARALRNRREARVLAGLDRHMLADIGITRSDVRDAFSSPIWEDPTALLRQRVLERRINRPIASRLPSRQPRFIEPGFHRPPTNRAARHTV